MGSNKVNFFFVGFPKSGSTLFWNMLREHPEIYSSPLKELNFFNTDHIEIIKQKLGKHYSEQISSKKEYESLYTHPESPFNGDFNPTYIYSHKAPELIYSYNENAKIIIAIREPVSYIRSTHFQNLYNLSEDEEDLLKALRLEKSRKAGRHIPELCTLPFFLIYSELVCYQKFIENYVKMFPTKHIEIILFDDIVKDKFIVYKDLIQFIGVRDINFKPSEPDHNPSHKLRFKSVRKYLLKPTIKKTILKIISKKMMPAGVKISHRLFKKEEKKPSLSDKALEELKSRFKPEVLLLNDYLSKKGLISVDLCKLWGY